MNRIVGEQLRASFQTQEFFQIAPILQYLLIAIFDLSEFIKLNKEEFSTLQEEISLEPIISIKRDVFLTFLWDICDKIFESFFKTPQEIGPFVNFSSFQGTLEFFNGLATLEKNEELEQFKPSVLTGIEMVQTSLLFGNQK